MTRPINRRRFLEQSAHVVADKANDRKYLAAMKRRCKDHGVESRLIMIDDEGNLGDADAAQRTKASRTTTSGALGKQKPNLGLERGQKRARLNV